MANRNYNTFFVCPHGTPLIEILKKRASYSQYRRHKYPTWTRWDLRIGYVYLMYFSLGDIYKIGVSQNVERRLNDIRSYIPISLTIEHIIKTDDTAIVESSFHEYFHDKRIQGEWFDLDKSDIDLFKSMQEVSVHWLTT